MAFYPLRLVSKVILREWSQRRVEGVIVFGQVRAYTRVYVTELLLQRLLIRRAPRVPGAEVRGRDVAEIVQVLQQFVPLAAPVFRGRPRGAGKHAPAAVVVRHFVAGRHRRGYPYGQRSGVTGGKVQVRQAVAGGNESFGSQVAVVG